MKGGSMRDDEDLVQLLDDVGQPIGAAPRADVHTSDTPLHLAFSCYLTRADGDLLLTRRALSKRTWPGVWTNSFCGHPRPGEPIEDAIARHAASELGIGVEDLVCVLPDFRYRATDASGVVENELCPVYLATPRDEPVPSPDEVVELAWVDPDRVRRLVETAPFLVSPWMTMQVAALPSLRRQDAQVGR
jgi:isopentenyl-diphosphate delta-isomerase